MFKCESRRPFPSIDKMWTHRKSCWRGRHRIKLFLFPPGIPLVCVCAAFAWHWRTPSLPGQCTRQVLTVLQLPLFLMSSICSYSKSFCIGTPSIKSHVRDDVTAIFGIPLVVCADVTFVLLDTSTLRGDACCTLRLSANNQTNTNGWYTSLTLSFWKSYQSMRQKKKRLINPTKTTKKLGRVPK